MHMKLGIIGAMDCEVALLKEAMVGTSTRVEAGMSFVSGCLGGVDAVVVKCGVGKTCAAACAQLLVSAFGATHLVNTGIAGGLDPALGVNDVVVATQCVYFDVDLTACGRELGQVSHFPVSFEADATLRRAMLDAAYRAPVVVHEGRIATGDLFISTEADRTRVHEQFDALCCDMEGAAIAQVAFMNQVPFAILRTISDLADGAFTDEQDESSAQLAATIVGNMVPLLTER